ncbi:MAG TPA: FxsA family protein [Acidimicrobiia bacterium]|nr:FxsA family protein [Acidimicrobiia bacterium]
MFVVVLLLVLWPLVEIAVFLQVVAWIGVLNTLAVMVAISICGAWLVKRQGIGTLARMRSELDDGRIPTGPMTDGGLLAAAGFLLLLPGFVSDVVGLALLVPPVRGVVRRALGRRFTVRTARVRRGRRPDYLDVDESRRRSDQRPDPPELLP